MLHKDIWLSGYFDQDAYIYKPPFEEAELPQGFICTKIPANDKNTFDKLCEQGFEMIETLVQFEQQEAVAFSNTNFDVRFSQPEDQEAVAAIAYDAFISSRLYQDPHISNDIASQIKTDWVRNFYAGKRGDKMIVAEENGRVIGFLLLIGNVIDLIAVSKNDYNKGVASAMIAFANEQVGLLKAGTQDINQASIALYKKCGFVKTQETYVLHYHRNLADNVG